MTFENSVLDIRNGGSGGLNVNTGDIVLSNTLLKGDGRNTGALFGAQKSGSIAFAGGAQIETPAGKNADNGGGETGANYIVTGGSFNIKSSSESMSIPVNGEENGNEKLDLVTLADSNVNEITVLNKKGETYQYSVGNASQDGKKHVYVPTVTVTFNLDSDTASFADNTPTSAKAIRGNNISMIAGAGIPADPINSDKNKAFSGWYYLDGDSEVKFDETTPVNDNMTVYAKWGNQRISKDDLGGDILLNGDTGHNAVPEVHPGNALPLTGQLDVTAIKNKIKSLKES